jgi:SAM-dependent methyltransferase
VVCDVTERRSELEGGFDLIVSWCVFEHVRPLDRALENLHAYLRPGGRLVAWVAGRNSLGALVNRALPYRVARKLLGWLAGRPPDSVFPAYYDRCTHSDLLALTAGWQRRNVVPYFQNAMYFRFSTPIRTLYLAGEEWAYQRGDPRLGTHFLLVADR